MYKITFNDGTTFKGGNPENSRWNEQPNLPIHYITYTLPWNGNTLLVAGFSEYNHLVEHNHAVIGTINNKISKIIILGKSILFPNTIYQVVIDLNHNMTFTSYVDESEFYNSLPGWKPGEASPHPQIEEFPRVD